MKFQITRWTLSVFDPTDLRRPPDLPPESAGLGTTAEKRVSSSDTSNSGALGERRLCQRIQMGN